MALAKNLIDKILKSRSPNDREELAHIVDLINQLNEQEFAENDWARLFCRQLKRLLDYNKTITNEIWLACRQDLHYILKNRNGEQNEDRNWEELLKRMNFESKLEQRELQFQEAFGERKSFSQLFCEHEDFFKEYFQKCIRLHAKVQVRGLIKDIDNLLSNIYGLEDISLTSESQKHLEEKLKCIEIDLDCSNKSLSRYELQTSTSRNPSERINNDLNNFLPSIELTEMDEETHENKTIGNLLRYNRWIVILGDPGSAKTTLLRWITYTLAEAALHNDESVILEGNSRIPVRIPILIRIGEFTTWLNEHQSKTLIDYIGEHTWFSERYCHVGNEYILKKLVYHGHALILLDGLDEIPEVKQRREIVDLVKKFIDEYVNGPEFFSAFDHCAFESVVVFDNMKPKLIEMQPPKKYGGNQIIVTSRIVGYQLNPLIGLHIQPYSLLLMNYQQAEEFATKWITQVAKCILNDLLNEGIQIDQEKIASLLKKRDNVIKALFENSLESLTSNPSLLSLICMSIFQSSNKFQPTSRIEVYYYAVQTVLNGWNRQKSSISESILTNFLIELANYLHLQSPSGLIDVFDLEHLCCLVLQQQGLFNNRTELRAYANKLVSLLDSNVGIVVERGLQVFSFIHLSLQEYFVAQGLVRSSSINEIVKLITRFIINPRFREPLRLAVAWISWQWSFDDYNKFCNILVTSTTDNAIPFGTLLFFDAFNDMIRLPSKSVIFTALNSLLCNTSEDFRSTHLLWNLSLLSDDIVTEWMELYLKDDKHLFNFCQCFITNRLEPLEQLGPVQKLAPIVYQKLWSFHNRNISTEFVIDQTLRRAIISDTITNQIFNKELSLYILSNNPRKSNINPLILAVIHAVCGGVPMKSTLSENLIILFSPKYMHRESSILDPIVKYLNNNQEPHSIKIQMVINYYQNFLQQSLPSDTSTDIVDTFIALICLQGLSQPSNYQKYKGYKALSLALERFKHIWFYLNEAKNNGNVNMETKISFIENEIKPIINVFFSQTDPSDEKASSFLSACATACKKLRKLDLTNPLHFNCNNDIDQDVHYQSKFIHFIDEKQLDLIAQNISSLKILQMKPLFLLNFLPQSLQQLYSCTIISPINKKDSLPLVVFLSQCLTYLENVDKQQNSNFYLALVLLQPLLKEHMLENYASVLFCEKYSNINYLETNVQAFLKAMKDRKLFDSFLIDHQSKNLKLFINIELQRISRIENVTQNQDKDLRLFSASISLARLYQAQYRFHKYKTIKYIGIPRAKSNNVYIGIMNILNPILQIIALHFILNMKDPLIFIEDQRDQLQSQMFFLLYSTLPDLPLLTSTLLFVQCYTIHHLFPLQFEHMANIIGKKWNQISVDKLNQGQKAAYIALKQLNNSGLSPYLSEFARRIINMSDVLNFNSTIFYDYLTNITSYHSVNRILLSIMYLNELILDVEILKIYTEADYKSDISPLKELEELWHELSKVELIMSFRVATWITNSLQTLNKKDIREIIEYLRRCSLIENNALPVIEKWLDYRKHKNLKIFAQYAALQLIIKGLNNSDLMDTINDLFVTDAWLSLKSFVKRLFNSQLVNSIIFREILLILQKNVYYSSKISVLIYCETNFKLILNLEYERIASDVCQKTTLSTNPFLLMIKNCSKDLQSYLENYLRSFIIEDVIQEKYIATLIKWIIENSIFNKIINGYNYIFTLLHNQHFPQVQKAIVNGLNSVFLNNGKYKNTILLQDVVIKNLEKMICNWNIYSKDIIAICLLAYGNYLLGLKECKKNRSISSKMKNICNILSETSTLEIISLRATFCLSFIEQSYIMFNRTFDWFSNKWNITSEEMYNILLNQTLYETENSPKKGAFEEFAEHLNKYSDDFMNMFIIDLYNYLCNKNERNYLSDPSPDFMAITLEVIENDWENFRYAVEKSSFGEKQFKTALSLHYGNNPRDDLSSIQLYMGFGILTTELLDMLERQEYDERCEVLIDLDGITQVSNQDDIEKIFELLVSNLSNEKCNRYILILEHLAELPDVSLLEIHQMISRINIMLHDNDDEWHDSKQHILNLLLDISCCDKEGVLSLSRRFVTQNEIDEEFRKEIEYLDKRSVLLFQDNPFCTDFSSVPN